MEFGFYIEKGCIREVFPEIFHDFTRKQRYQMFLAQYNACVEEALRIPPAYSKRYRNLQAIFHAKIEKLLRTPPFFKQDKAISFCPESARLIHAFKSDQLDNLIFGSVLPKHPAARLIAMIYAKDYPGVSFDATMMFSQYVFDKICRRNRDKKVYFDGEMIVIEDKGEKVLGVLPCFKHVNGEDPYCVKEEINQGFATLACGNVPKLFLVFPRNKEFKRHVALKESHFEEGNPRLKLVPYSISNKIVRSL